MFETTCAIADWEPASDIKNCIKTKKNCESICLLVAVVVSSGVLSYQYDKLEVKIWGIFTSIWIISCFRQIWSVHDLFVIPKTFVQISLRFLSVHAKVHLISWYLTWCGRICHKEVSKFCVPYFVRSHEKKLNLSPKFDQLNGGIFSFSHIYKATMAMS